MLSNVSNQPNDRTTCMQIYMCKQYLTDSVRLVFQGGGWLKKKTEVIHTFKIATYLYIIYSSYLFVLFVFCDARLIFCYEKSAVHLCIN